MGVGIGPDPIELPGPGGSDRVLIRVPCSVPLSLDIFQGWQQEKSFFPRPWGWPGFSSSVPPATRASPSHSELSEQKSEQLADVGDFLGTANQFHS